MVKVVKASKKTMKNKKVKLDKTLKQWVCLVNHADSGCVPYVHKFVSKKEYDLAHGLLEPLVGNYWGNFTSYDE